jgi:OmpR-family two-component system manganese-sensing response regulator
LPSKNSCKHLFLYIVFTTQLTHPVEYAKMASVRSWVLLLSKILVADDDAAVTQMVVEFLETQRHTAEAFFDGEDAYHQLRLYSYDLAVLDWAMPTMSGLDSCRKYRDGGGKTPILILTGKSTIDEKELAFNAGADDYLTKPFQIRELALRVTALLRRSPDLVMPAKSVGNLKLDYQSYSLIRDGERIPLLPKEFALVEFLLRHPDQFFTPEQLLNRVWESDSEATLDALRTCIKRIRQRVDKEGQPSLIASVRGYGYKITPA